MRFRFSVRDLLWLTLTVALTAGWWLDHWRYRDEWVQESLDRDKIVLLQRSTEVRHIIPFKQSSGASHAED